LSAMRSSGKGKFWGCYQRGPVFFVPSQFLRAKRSEERKTKTDERKREKEDRGVARLAKKGGGNLSRKKAEPKED